MLLYLPLLCGSYYEKFRTVNIVITIVIVIGSLKTFYKVIQPRQCDAMPCQSEAVAK